MPILPPGFFLERKMIEKIGNETRDLLEALFGEAVSEEFRIGVFTLPGKRARHFTAVEDATKYALSRAGDLNVFYQVCLAARGFGRKNSAEDIAVIAGLWADVDMTAPYRADKPLPQNEDEARGLLAKLPMPPSIVVHSGHGLHVYWLFKEPWVLETEDEWKSAARLAHGWHALLCALAFERGWKMENTGDLARVLRLPGTVNRKIPESPVPVRLLEHHEARRYNPEDFEPYIEESAVAPDGGPVIGDICLRPDAEPPSTKFGDLLLNCRAFGEAWNRNRPELADQSQSAYDMSLATIAVLNDWTDQEIADLIIAARRRHNEKPEKALRADYVAGTISRAREGKESGNVEVVDLSGILDEAPLPQELEDPGPIPVELLRVPGFISEVMDFTLETAPYPEPVLAFCGALCLQAILAARKVRDEGDNRTNIYLLGLANSGAGKDWPRKVNQRVLIEADLADAIGDNFASGEGIEDRMFLTKAVLFQNDEINGLINAISKGRDVRYEGIMNVLLKFYSAANTYYPLRVKAGCEEPRVVDQPCLCIFGTAIPKQYYEAMCLKMLTNGFFARMLVLEGGKRSKGQEARRLPLPERVLETAAHWAKFRPGGGGNLLDWHPDPRVVPCSADALKRLQEIREQADEEYSKAEDRQDQAAMAVWARANEKARHLALIRACSEAYQDPKIVAAGADWAGQFISHLTKRMLFMAADHVSQGEFDARCKDMLRVLREWRSHKGAEPMPEWQLNRKLSWKPRDHAEVREALMAQKRIDYRPVASGRRIQKLYWLLGSA